MTRIPEYINKTIKSVTMKTFCKFSYLTDISQTTLKTMTDKYVWKVAMMMATVKVNPRGDVDGRTGTQEPVAGEGVVEGREAEEEDTEQGEAGGDEDEGERPPVVPGGSLPRLVVCQLVQSEDGPEECEAGDEDDVR